MSRTYRRKNAWNKNHRINEYLKSADSRFDSEFPWVWWTPKYKNKYKDWTEKEIVNHVAAKFHSDAWLDDTIIENQYKRGSGKILRNKGKQQLIEALNRGEEEDLLPILISRQTDYWWFDWAYYW